MKTTSFTAPVAGWYRFTWDVPARSIQLALLHSNTRTPITMNITRSLHSATAHVARLFSYDHLPPWLQVVSKPFHDLAERLINSHADGPELTVALRHLADAKNSAVQHAVLTDQDVAGKIRATPPVSEDASER